MNMIVCAKQVIDPEAPPTSIRVDPVTGKVVPQLGVAWVINPYDEQATEAALRIEDTEGGKTTVMSLGSGLLRDVLKKTLAMGADELILLEGGAFADSDSWSTAYALAMAIKKVGAYDIIFCGREASNTNAGQVGSGIAEILGLPSVTLAKK